MLGDIRLAHERLKRRIHDHFNSLSNRGRKTVAFAYFIIPLLAFYPVMQWAQMHATANEQLWKRIKEYDEEKERSIRKQPYKQDGSFGLVTLEGDISRKNIDDKNKHVMEIIKNAAESNENSAREWGKENHHSSVLNRKGMSADVDRILKNIQK